MTLDHSALFAEGADDLVHVVTVDDEAHAFDSVTVLDSGWLSCWIETPEGHVNEKYPPQRVRRVVQEVGERR